jgi:hypothetical protein
MAIDERRWLELWDAARRELGEEPAITLMELLRAVARDEEARATDPVVRFSDLQGRSSK